MCGMRIMNYQEIGAEIGKLVEDKQAAYGDSFGKTGDFLRLCYPDGIPVEKYDDALCLVRIFDKLMRIATDKDALGESPYRDIAGYGLLGVKKDEKHAAGGPKLPRIERSRKEAGKGMRDE